MVEINLYNIDKKFWKTKDKEWVEVRKSEWERIQNWVLFRRNKGETNIAKQYFLRGKTPDWKKLKQDVKKNQQAILDVMLLLWLHPSDDVEVLMPIFKGYVECEDVRPVDIAVGLGHFTECEFTRSTMPVLNMEVYDFTYMGKKNKILFEVMLGDIEYLKKIPIIFKRKTSRGKYAKYKENHFYRYGYIKLVQFWLWLKKENQIEEINRDSLFQYEDVLEYIYTCCQEEKDYFINLHPDALPEIYKLLYCVFNVTEKHPTDSIYADSAVYLRTIFDEREFAPEFKQMWLDVKSGKIQVENAWER